MYPGDDVDVDHVQVDYAIGCPKPLVVGLPASSKLPNGTPKSIRWLREAEADALIEAAAALPGAIGLAGFITISLHTGMRCLVEVAEGVEIALTGEPCGLSQLSGLPG